MVDIEKFNLILKSKPNAPTTIEEALKLWEKVPNKEEIFQGHFLIRLTSELSQVEGIDVSYHRTRELFENEYVKNYSGDLRDLYSVLNNRTLAAYLTKCLKDGMPLSTELIKESHRLLMFGSIDRHSYEDNGERAGEFRKNDYVVGKHDTGSDASEIPELIEDLISLVLPLKDEHPDKVKLAAVFHCYFEGIHPFCDGNGRVGRWLTNYLLVSSGYPPLLFDGRKIEQYYKALEVFDEEEDYGPMYEYIKSEIIASASAWRDMVPVGGTGSAK